MSKVYFNEDTENSIIEYINSDSDGTREVIFVNILKEPFERLIENIIFTYKFHTLESDWVYLQQEVLTHIYWNIDKFDTTKGHKAFSYFGTIAKNYLIQKSVKKTQELSNNISLEQAELEGTFSQKKEFVDDSFLMGKDSEEFIGFLINEFEKEYKKVIFKKDQRKTIEAIIHFLETRDNQDIQNKKTLYVLLKERTGLNTRQLTRCLKCVREVYKKTKKKYYT